MFAEYKVSALPIVDKDGKETLNTLQVYRIYNHHTLWVQFKSFYFQF